jgi:hypothetical protein
MPNLDCQQHTAAAIAAIKRLARVRPGMFPGPGIYVIRAGSDRFVKIGFTTSLAGRLGALTAGNHRELKTLAFVATDHQSGCAAEQAIHAAFSEHRAPSGWFAMAPCVFAFVRWVVQEGDAPRVRRTRPHCSHAVEKTTQRDSPVLRAIFGISSEQRATSSG